MFSVALHVQYIFPQNSESAMTLAAAISFIVSLHCLKTKPLFFVEFNSPLVLLFVRKVGEETRDKDVCHTYKWKP